MRRLVGDFKSNPGNANLPIGEAGAAGGRKDANREIGVPGAVPGIFGVGWRSRGYLPHFESVEATQHVTFHLADSLPQTVLSRLEAELKTLPAEKRNVERRKRLDAWIDAGHGSCALRKPGIADMVQGSLLTFDSQRYRLLAWVVMPNHVHVLFQPMRDGPSRRSWRRGRSSRPAKFAMTAWKAAGCLSLPSGTGNIGIGIFATVCISSKRWSTSI